MANIQRPTNTLLIIIIMIIAPVAIDQYQVKTAWIERSNTTNPSLVMSPSIDTYASSIDGSDPISLDKGEDFSDPLNITMLPGSADIVLQGIFSGELNNTLPYPELHFMFNLNDSGPVLIEVSTPIEIEKFQIFFDVIPNLDADVLGSSYVGNPVIFEYFAETAGTNYMYLSGFDNNFEDDFDIFSGDEVPFQITITQFRKGTAPQGASTDTIRGESFETIEHIFGFYGQSGYINEFDQINLDRGGLIDSLIFDPDDLDFYKGIGLSIYGLMRTAQMFSNTVPIEEKTNILWKYTSYAIDLFNYANQSGNIVEDAGSIFYVKPVDSTTAFLKDQAYMLFGMGEILFETGRGEYLLNSTQIAFLDELAEWSVLLANSIISNFEDTFLDGLYFEELSGIGTSTSLGDISYLESMTVTAEALEFVTTAIAPWSNSTSLVNETAFIGIDSVVPTYFLVTDSTNTVKDMHTDPLNDVGIGVEYYNNSTQTLSNSSTLSGNMAYLMRRVNFDFEFSSLFLQNVFRFFESSDSELLLSQVNIIEDQTINPRLISTLDNAMAILLSQRLEIKWSEELATDVSRAWGRKVISHFNSLYDLMWDDVDNAFFAQYDNEANILVIDDNIVESNRFVANTFLTAFLVRVFPVELGVIYQNNIRINEPGILNLELQQIKLLDSLQWFDFIVSFDFDLKVRIPKFDLEFAESIKLSDFFDFDFLGGEIGDSKFLAFEYIPESRGAYKIFIELSRENNILLSWTLDLTALGIINPELDGSDLSFASDDSTFTAEFSLIDETGTAVPNLSVNSSLGKNFANQNIEKYIKTARSDASGQISLNFDTSSIYQDGLLDASKLLSQQFVPEFVQVLLYVNITNALEKNFQQVDDIIRLPINVRLSRYFAEGDIDDLEFATQDSEFSTEVTIFDYTGQAASNLQISASLGLLSNESINRFGLKYQSIGTTDVSGKAELSFNVGEVEGDLFNRSDLNQIVIDRGFTFTNLFLNITSNANPNFAGIIGLRVKIVLSKPFLRVSPTSLELTQGTTESFSFVATALDQNQEPIPNAVISYTVPEAPVISNTVFTDADGEASISLRDNDLFALSNLAIIKNTGRANDELVVTNTTLNLIFSSENFPSKTVSKVITILPNNLAITANPVQLSTREATLIETNIPPVEIEVAVSDLFARVVNAFVSIRWADEGVNDYVDLRDSQEHISPHTFSLDPKNLPAGDYLLEIIAVKDGITQITEIEAQVPDDDNLALSQSVPPRPVITHRTIVIQSATIVDIIISTISVFGALIVANFGWYFLKKGLGLFGYYKECQHCEEEVRRTKEICPNCGRVTGFGDDINPEVSKNKDINESPAKEE